MKRRKGILAKRSLRPVVEKKAPKNNVQQELQCAVICLCAKKWHAICFLLKKQGQRCYYIGEMD